MNKKLLFESFLVTTLVLVVLWLLFLALNYTFKSLNFVQDTLEEININDLYYSSIANNSIDSSIVIVNIEDLDRKGIADVLLKVNEADPAVIGLDVFFSAYKVTSDDSLIISTLDEIKDKLVMVSNYMDDGEIDENFWYNNEFNNGHGGILTNQDKSAVVREFEPKISTNSGTVLSFSSMVVSGFDKEALAVLHQRNNNKETINYIGGAHAFRIINYRDLLHSSDADLRQLNRKIVIIGFCGGNRQSLSDAGDIFYTPVGFELSVNRSPDMYGVLVHANIASMIISQRYVNHMPGWIVFLITFMMTYLLVVLFANLYLKKQAYFHVVAKLIQAVSFVLILWLVFLIFSKFYLYVPTKYLLASVILSVEILNFYRILARRVFKKYRIRSIFVQPH